MSFSSQSEKVLQKSNMSHLPLFPTPLILCLCSPVSCSLPHCRISSFSVLTSSRFFESGLVFGMLLSDLHQHLVDEEGTRMGDKGEEKAGYCCRLSCSISVMSCCSVWNSQGPPTRSSRGCWLWRWGRELCRIDEHCHEMACLHHSLIWDVCVSSRIVACSSMMRKAIAVTHWRATCSAMVVISGVLILNCHHIHLRAIRCTSQNSERHFHYQ